MSKVAWIPTNHNNFNLNEYGVKSTGGKIIEDSLTESRAETAAFKLNEQTIEQQGMYIVIYS